GGAADKTAVGCRRREGGAERMAQTDTERQSGKTAASNQDIEIGTRHVWYLMHKSAQNRGTIARGRQYQFQSIRLAPRQLLMTGLTRRPIPYATKARNRALPPGR